MGIEPSARRITSGVFEKRLGRLRPAEASRGRSQGLFMLIRRMAVSMPPARSVFIRLLSDRSASTLFRPSTVTRIL